MGLEKQYSAESARWFQIGDEDKFLLTTTCYLYFLRSISFMLKGPLRKRMRKTCCYNIITRKRACLHVACASIIKKRNSAKTARGSKTIRNAHQEMLYMKRYECDTSGTVSRNPCEKQQ